MVLLFLFFVTGRLIFKNLLGFLLLAVSAFAAVAFLSSIIDALSSTPSSVCAALGLLSFFFRCYSF
jgi:hypothetical protein